MPSKRPSTPTRGRKPTRRSVAKPVRDAAARAVEKVLRSEEAFALMIRKLEAAGWHVERSVSGDDAPASPTRPA